MEIQAMVLPMAIALVVSLILGKFIIPWLRAMKAGQSIREIGPSWHNSKAGTPTMGGMIFIFGGAIAMVIFGWQDMMEGHFDHIFVLAFSCVFGLIGFLDDYVKVKKKQNLGLTSWQKLALQLAASACYVVLLRWNGQLTGEIYIPFIGTSLEMPWMVYMVFAVFVIVGCVNAVNLTDGIDGLASGVTVPVMVFFTVVAVLYGNMTVALFPATLIGGLLGFLVYNYHPAKVFMGDTGSLFLGAAVCGMAFALDIPLILLLVGLIYIIETVSVIMQVTYFKLTHGKRIFKMTPIHHHFEMSGWKEKKIFWVFTGITVICCVVAYWGIC